MKDSTVAARYAHALLIVTERRGETDRALDDLRAVAELLRPGSSVGAMLAGPLIHLSDKRAVLSRVLEGKALPAIVLFVDLLLRKHRLAELPAIAEEFQALVERKHGIRRAVVTSAVPLTDAERERLHRELEQLTGGSVRLSAEIDPRLVGGANVRIGARLIDRSVKTLLEAIEQQLHQTSV